jgi:hypothetical protein
MHYQDWIEDSRMPVTSSPIRILVAAILGLLVTTGCGDSNSSSKPTLVEVWRGGDDGLTVRLSEALETAFRSSSDFALTTGTKPGTLMVVGPTNTRRKQVAARTEIVYAVEFASTDGRALGASSGSCWEVELQVCVVRIVEDAKAAAAKLSKASDPKGG